MNQYDYIIKDGINNIEHIVCNTAFRSMYDVGKHYILGITKSRRASETGTPSVDMRGQGEYSSNSLSLKNLIILNHFIFQIVLPI